MKSVPKGLARSIVVKRATRRAAVTKLIFVLCGASICAALLTVVAHAGEHTVRLQLSDLIAKAPIIVPITTNGYNHFVAFRGIQGEHVLLADPAWGREKSQTTKQYGSGPRCMQ
jgi:hypothetical protein